MSESTDDDMVAALEAADEGAFDKVAGMSEFDAAWNEAKAIDGWYGENEARALFEAALAVPEGQMIVEVGSWRGRSAAILAAAGRQVLLLDPMVPFEGALVPEIADMRALAEFDAAHANVEWRRYSVQEVEPHMGSYDSIGLLHVDGCHLWPHPLNDYLALEDHLAPGAFVAFHDAVGNKAPDRTVMALVAAGRLRAVDGAGGLRVLRRTT